MKYFIHRPGLTLFFAFSSASLSPAQSPVVLVLEGDSVPGVGLVTQIENIAVDDEGNWLVEVDTDNADTDADGAILRNGALYLREGDAVGAPIGASIDTFDSAEFGGAGAAVFNFVLAGTAGGTNDNAGVYKDGALVVQKGDVSAAAGFGAGTVYRSFDDVKLTDDDRVFLRGFLADDPTVAGTTDFYAVVLQLDAGGAVIGETLVAAEGQVPPGQTLTINTIRTGSHSGAANNVGDVIWCADLDTGSPPMDAVCYMNNTLLAQEGVAFPPVPGRTWGDIVSPEVDVNDVGDWTFKDRLDGSDFTTDEIIVKNGAVFRREGDSLPAIGAFVFRRFGNGPVDLTDGGDVLWYGDWDDPDTDVDEGLFLNDVLLVQEGVTQVGGVTIDDVGDQSDNYFISDDGGLVIFEATLAGGLEGAFLIDLDLGDNFCIAAPNSTGFPAGIAAEGSAGVAANDLTLLGQPVPASQNGLFYYGPNMIQVPFGNGFRCVGGAMVFRLAVETASAGGVLAHALDNTVPPTPAGQITAGATWNFQGWYRDPAAGGAFFNLTDGLTVTFEP